MKICSACKEEKTLDCFHKNKWKKDGYAHVCKPCKQQFKKKDYEKNRHKYRENQKEYYSKNKDAIKEKVKSWRENNLAKYNAKCAKYRADKIKATPAWADLKKIEEIYKQRDEMTKESGINYNVDHIIPLHGKTVCGLHCEANLSIISQSANASKSNKLLDEVANG